MKHSFCNEPISLSVTLAWAISFFSVSAFIPDQTTTRNRRMTTIRGDRARMASKRKLQTDDDFIRSLSKIEFDLVPSICDIAPEEWDSCLSRHSSPFMQHAWLRCLEESGCTTAETGWMPSHVAIRSGDVVCGYVPVSFAQPR
jgi:hypothetical protein